jgi:hypothetical protein
MDNFGGDGQNIWTHVLSLGVGLQNLSAKELQDGKIFDFPCLGCIIHHLKLSEIPI